MTLPLPVTIEIGAKGPGAAPDWSSPETLLGVKHIEPAWHYRFGDESLSITLDDDAAAIDVAAAVAWLDAAHLMRPIRASDTDGEIWRGVLVGIKATIAGKTFSIDLKDLANYLIVHYQVGGTNAQKSTTALTAPDSIDAYGRKDRILSLDNTTDAGALQRAQTGLNLIAYPQASESSEAETDAGGAPELEHQAVSVELTCMGVYGLLEHVTLTSGSRTLTETSTQVAALLSAYAGVNAFFDSGATDIVSTGVSETEHTGDDTSYKSQIEKLLTLGNSAHQPLAWGFSGGVFRVAVAARATPTTIAYKEYTRTGLITDADGAPMHPWRVRPNAMALIADVSPAAPPSAAIDGPARKYVARVRCTIDESGAKATLEPDNADPLDALLAHPVGNPADNSTRTDAIARTVAALIRPIASKTSGTVDLHGATLDPTQPVGSTPGDIGNTGSQPVDLGVLTGSVPPVTGGPIVGAGSGVAGELAQWSDDHTLVASGMTVDTSGATNGAALIYDSIAGVWKPGVGTGTGTLSGTGTPGMLTRWTPAGTDIEDAGLIHSGTNTVTIDTPGGDFTLTLAHGGTLDLAGFAFTLVNGSLTFNDFDEDRTLSVRKDGGVVVGAGSGVANRLAYWVDEFEIAASDFDITTLTAGLVSGSGTPGMLTRWDETGSAIEDAGLIHDGTNTVTLATLGGDFTLTLSHGGTLDLDGNTLTMQSDAVLNLHGNTFMLDGTMEIDPNGASDLYVLAYDGGGGIWTPRAPSDLFGSGTPQQLTRWNSSGDGLEDAHVYHSGGGNLLFDTSSVPATTEIDFTGAAPGDFLRYQGSGYWSAETVLVATGSGPTYHLPMWDFDHITLIDSNVEIGVPSTGGRLYLNGDFTVDSGTLNLNGNTISASNGGSTGEIVFGYESNTGGSGSLALFANEHEIGTVSGLYYDGADLQIPGAVNATHLTTSGHTLRVTGTPSSSGDVAVGHTVTIEIDGANHTFLLA